MASRTAILSVRIISDAKDFSKSMDESVSKMDKFQQKMNKLTVPALAVVGGLATIGKGFFDAASDAQQAQGGVEAVFGSWSKKVDEFASTSAERLGLSGAAYDTLAARIGTSLKSAGVPMDQLAIKTDELSSLGADLASVFGGTTSEAVDAMGAAFRGEYDSLERFGIVLNDSTIMAALQEKGLDKLTGAELTAAKQQEVLNQLMSQGAPYMGNFAKEADTAAGAQERLSAKFQDVSAQLGEALLPLMVSFAEVASQVATWVSENIGLVQTLAVILGVLAAAVLVLNAAMFAMNVIAALNPFVLLAIAVAALIAVIVWLATQTTFFQDIWANMCRNAQAQFGPLVGFIKDAWNNTVRFLSDTVNNVGNFFRSVFGNIGNFVGGVVNNIRSFFSGAFNTISSIVNGVISGITGAFQRISGTVGSVVGSVQSAFGSAFNHIQNVASGVINNIVGFFGRISGAVQGAINWVRNLFNMGGMPGWLSGVLGLGGTGFTVDGAFAAGVPGEFGLGATGMSLFASGSSGQRSGVSVTPIVVTVNIEATPGTDRVALGKEIVSVIRDYERATGRKN